MRSRASGGMTRGYRGLQRCTATHTSRRSQERRLWWKGPLEALPPDLGPHEDEVSGGGLEGHDAREEVVDAVAEGPQVAEPHTAHRCRGRKVTAEISMTGMQNHCIGQGSDISAPSSGMKCALTCLPP